MKFINNYLFFIGLFVTSTINAVDMESIPHVNEKASNSFKYDYLYANENRAFAIAPGGAWSWVANKETVNEARDAAINTCSQHTQQKCVLFSVNKRIIFQYKKWYELWGPYLTKQQANNAETGVKVGQKFPDIEYINPTGEKISIHKLKGKVTFVHFWGSWCPSCGYEFPTIMDMYRIVNDLMPEKIEFVILQMRESIKTSKQWAHDSSMENLPLSDSGIKNEEDNYLKIKSGNKMRDRELAKIFPASYVLDKNGIVIFSNMGSIENWTEYIGFFKHAVKKS